MECLLVIDLLLLKQKKVAAAKATDMKRTRIERTLLEDMLFEHFEEQAHWTLKQLVSKTEQPEVYIGVGCVHKYRFPI
jgi:hypothetical protein